MSFPMATSSTTCFEFVGWPFRAVTVSPKGPAYRTDRDGPEGPSYGDDDGPEGPSYTSWMQRLIRRFAPIAVAICLLQAARFAVAAEPVRLTKDQQYKQDLAWMQPGEEYVYVQQETPALLAIMRFRPADGRIERLHPTANTAELEPCFTPDGSRCAFVQSRGNLSLTLVIETVGTTKSATFNPGGGFAGIRHPAFAPDGSKVAFSMPANGGQQILTVDHQGQNRVDLTRSIGINNHPQFSPDGSKIVFSSSRDEDFEIYVMDANGSNPRRLTDRAGMDLRSRWSPDGKRIAFVSNRDGNYEIYVMRADGSSLINLTQSAARDDFPVWHPDGKRLAFLSDRDGGHDLYTVEVP